jgi:bifunctional N-acetylglucosamine-1-phosphate-uridyltransferase/glucosamine-1-phosphate-acetyltransferase GlmU-like protein
MFAPEEYLDLEQTAHAGLFGGVPNVWSVLSHLKGYLETQLEPSVEGILVGQPFIGERVRIGKGTVVEPGAVIKGPAWIGENCEIRSGCYIRENVIVGDGAVLGNSCEFKNCLLFDGVQVPHFNYVGDSILGFKAHLGAGVILSNVRLDHKEVVVTTSDGLISSGLKKFGAMPC